MVATVNYHSSGVFGIMSVKVYADGKGPNSMGWY